MTGMEHCIQELLAPRSTHAHNTPHARPYVRQRRPGHMVGTAFPMGSFPGTRRGYA